MHNERFDQAIAKETELQEELVEIQRKNTTLEDEIVRVRKILIESEQEAGQREMMIRQIKDMEEREEKRETYIKGVEKQLR
jgi:hypothetical protein